MSLYHFSSGFIKDLNDFSMLLNACLLFLLNVTLRDGCGKRLSMKHSKCTDRQYRGLRWLLRGAPS